MEHTHDGEPSRRHYQRGCRHPDCVEANNAYRRSGAPRVSARRGTRACYVRCVRRPEGPHAECREANRRYQAPRRRRVSRPDVAARSWNRWTPAEDAVLLAHDDETAARMLGRLPSAVRARRRRVTA